MIDITFDELLEAAQNLSDVQKEILIARIQIPSSPSPPMPLTKASILAEFERRKALGLFDHAESLAGKFKNLDAPDISDEDLEATLREIRTEWEGELDEFFGNNDSD